MTGICKLGSAADLAPLLSRSRRRRIKTKETEEANETNANGNFFFDEDRQTDGRTDRQDCADFYPEREERRGSVSFCAAETEERKDEPGELFLL